MSSKKNGKISKSDKSVSERKSPRRSTVETLAQRSSRVEEDAVGDDEVLAALAALDDGGIVEPYENHGVQAGSEDDEEDGDLSTAAVLERLRKKRMETQAFLSSRQEVGK